MTDPSRAGFRLLIRLAAAGVLLMTASCASFGPKTIPRDQFDYGTAIRSSTKEQLLFNIVGLRYVDAPVFVDVASVINSYSLEGTVDLGAGFNTGVGGDTVAVGGSGRYSDRPTITYAPVSGQKFATSLLTPVSPASLFALIQAGWPPEYLLRLTVRSINGLDNEWASPAQRKPADPEFIELLDAWGRLRKARGLGLRRQVSENQKEQRANILVYKAPEGLDENLEADLELVHRVLDLDPSVGEYALHYGLVPDGPDEIVVLTSSILEIMNELAWRIDVPPEHVEEGRTGPSFETEDERWTQLIQIRVSEDQPKDAYVAVRNRDHWFYLDDRDLRSKRAFAILQIMLSLTDTGDAARGPVVSITN